MKDWVAAFRRWVEALEEVPIGPAGWTAGFLSIVAVRHLLELRSSGYPLYPASAFYVHYVLAYLAPLLALCMILAGFSGVRLERVLRLMLLAWGLTLLPPLLDTLLARTHEAKIGYMELGETPWTSVLLRFFDPTYALAGTTPGIRIEAAAACILGFTYVALRARAGRWGRAIAAAACVYVTSLIFFTLPTLFLRALRLLEPGLTITALGSVGRVARPLSAEVRADQPILIYLIPFTLILAATALAVSRPELLRRAFIGAVRGEGWSWAVSAGAGSYAGWRILEGVPGPVATLPFDRLALCVCPLALLMAGSALSLLATGGDARGPDAAGTEPGLLASPGSAGDGADGDARTVGAILLVAAALLAASASIEFAAFGAIALGAGCLSRGVTRVLPWAVLAPQLASGIAALASFLAGYSLAAGDEAVILLPSSLYLIVFLAGFLADLPRALDLLRSLTGLAPMAAASVPLLVLVIACAALHARPGTFSIVVASLLSLAIVAAAQVLTRRVSAAAGLLGAGLVLSLLVGDPSFAAVWRAQALTSPTYFLRLAERRETAGDLEAAAGAADEAIRRDPDLASAHQRLGLIRYKRGDFPGAIEALQAAIALDPSDADLRANLATSQLKAARNEDALATSEEASRLANATPKVFFVLAQCLDASGRHADANAAWKEYVARAADVPDEAPYLELARRRLAGGPTP